MPVDYAEQGLIPVREADYLEQDPQIRGQRFACISFVSPRDAIASKEAYAARKFLSDVAKDVAQTLENVDAAFGEVNSSIRDTVSQLKERHAYLWDEAAVQQEYKLFLTQQATEIDDGFIVEHGNFKSSVHGFKIRGVYDSVEEAKDRGKAIRRFDDKFHVYVSEVGCWCPWNPSADKIDAEYAEAQLNTMMKKYDEGQEAKDEIYNQRKDASIDRMGKDRQVWLERMKADVAARQMEQAEERAKAIVAAEEEAEERAKAIVAAEEEAAPAAAEDPELETRRVESADAEPSVSADDGDVAIAVAADDGEVVAE